MAKAMSLDFTNVREGGAFNKKRQKAGDYRATVTKVEDAKSKSSGDPMWLYTIQVGSGKYPYYCQFTENTVWKIRNLLTAAGVKVPKKRVRVNPDLVVGKDIGVTLEDQEYEGRLQSEVASVFPLSELTAANEPDSDDEDEDEVVAEPEDEDEDEEETPKAKKPKKDKKPKATAADVTDDELEELDIEEM